MELLWGAGRLGPTLSPTVGRWRRPDEDLTRGHVGHCSANLPRRKFV
ncbi:hypothetical protein ACFFX0_31810 [Citricoccus parietis]|uniref:Uncharacterized protein n=1 Tax=Citricoccus parietis TaxID=592307 RepID=A0ABV5G9A2_9MICC